MNSPSATASVPAESRGRRLLVPVLSTSADEYPPPSRLPRRPSFSRSRHGGPGKTPLGNWSSNPAIQPTPFSAGAEAGGPWPLGARQGQAAGPTASARAASAHGLGVQADWQRQRRPARRRPARVPPPPRRAAGVEPPVAAHRPPLRSPWRPRQGHGALPACPTPRARPPGALWDATRTYSRGLAARGGCRFQIGFPCARYAYAG